MRNNGVKFFSSGQCGFPVSLCAALIYSSLLSTAWFPDSFLGLATATSKQQINLLQYRNQAQPDVLTFRTNTDLQLSSKLSWLSSLLCVFCNSWQPSYLLDQNGTCLGEFWDSTTWQACAYWVQLKNITRNFFISVSNSDILGGMWSREEITTVEESSEVIQCLSSHLTSFAVLVIVTNEKEVHY